MATISNFNIDQGSSFSSVINVSTTTSGLFQLNAYAARGKIRKSYSTSKYTSFACAVNENSPSQDTITISLTATQTKSLKPGRYVYDVEVYNSTSGDVIRIVEGQIEILASATQANPLSEGIEFKYTEENFVPHYMYNPVNGDQYYTSDYAAHQAYATAGYVHVPPIGQADRSATASEYVAGSQQSALDTISSTESSQATDTTNNSPADSGGEGSSYY